MLNSQTATVASTRIGLGSVQFGRDYGISNKSGQTQQAEVSHILTLAAHYGLQYLDTAPLYGSSEEVLGKAMANDYPFKIVTKTLSLQKNSIHPSDIEIVRKTLAQSLIRLKQASVYGVLCHNANDLLVPGGECLYEEMLTLKAQGIIKKIGVSIYHEKEIDLLLNKYSIDIIQLPLNVLDQRFLHNGYLKAFKQANIETHARSIFLQGLLLMPVHEIPAYFSPVMEQLNAYQHFLTIQKMTPLTAALGFVLGVPDIDVIICGINNATQLRELLAVQTPLQSNLFNAFQFADECYWNPSKWILANQHGIRT